MGFKKTHWLFHLLALAAIVALASVRCGHDTADKNPPSIKEAPHDCPPDNSCAEGHCATNPVNNNASGEQEKAENEIIAEAQSDAGDGLYTARHCETEEHCGCGYECADNQCHKVDSSCCANADCQPGYFCSDHNDTLIGTCKPWECDTNNHCNRCGMYCENHLCAQEYCCADADCPTGELCGFYHRENNQGFCIKPECESDADCGCGRFCNKQLFRCSLWRDDDADDQDTRQNPCCGTDFYYAGQCYEHEYIENGRCFEDEHCQTGKVCVWRTCLPATCANNADCGCEAVCRKGHCEHGCDDTSGCCNEGDVCDRGECINPNEEEEEDK